MTEDPDEAWVVRTFTGLGPALPGLQVGVGDDAAVLANGQLLTTDVMVEGVHWDARLSAEDVGWKLVAVNVSDIGAMGGRPTWALLGLCLPRPLDRAWVLSFSEGVRAACARFGVTLVGGDTTRAPVRFASLTVGGHAARPVLRSGARPGDRLWVTGELGRAAEAFLSPAPAAAAAAWLRRPVPPIAFGAALGEAGLATAMMDLSDGLAMDLARLCAASGVGADVRGEALPGRRPLDWRTSFGEDYELLFTAPPSAHAAVASLAERQQVAVTEIGEITADPRARLDGASTWPAPLFTHFGEPT